MCPNDLVIHQDKIDLLYRDDHNRVMGSGFYNMIFSKWYKKASLEIPDFGVLQDFFAWNLSANKLK